MKPIIFVKITEMEYYRGITDSDKPYKGGAYVQKTGDAGECYNFDPVNFNGEEVCLGFAMLIGNSRNTNIQIKLENIIGCKGFNKEDSVDDVIVVWCALNEKSRTMRVVGFYKNATVFRRTQHIDLYDEEGNFVAEQYYNFIADKKDCVLLPLRERFMKSEWFVPLSGKYGYDFGFGHSSVWFANGKYFNPDEQAFAEQMIKNIENYNGKNLMDEEA